MSWTAPEGSVRSISWSTTILRDGSGKRRHIIAAGVDITESKRLQKAVLDISAREQRRIGQDLHDGLGQHLTGIAFLSKALVHKVAAEVSEDASKIVRLVNEAINKTRELARGLLPVQSEAVGLSYALQSWSAEIEKLFGINCRFVSAEPPILMHNEDVAEHAYRIAQEAVNNAIKHAHPSLIEISLEEDGEWIVMTIQDDGIGLPETIQTRGLGLQIMDYRAKMIGGELQVQRGVAGGTVVICRVPSGMPSDLPSIPTER
jgi:signal transduction histidine kinase